MIRLLGIIISIWNWIKKEIIAISFISFIFAFFYVIISDFLEMFQDAQWLISFSLFIRYAVIPLMFIVILLAIVMRVFNPTKDLPEKTA